MAKPHNKGQIIRTLLAEGHSYSQIVLLIGCTKSTISYHAKAVGYPSRAYPHYDWRLVRDYYESGHGALECLGHFGMSGSAWTDAISRGDITPRRRGLPLASFLVSGRGKQVSTSALGLRLVKAGVFEYKCHRCGLTEWLGEALRLQLDHKNGDNADHRIENLWMLCPNCHSQTDTYAGRNKKLRRLARTQNTRA